MMSVTLRLVELSAAATACLSYCGNTRKYVGVAEKSHSRSAANHRIYCRLPGAAPVRVAMKSQVVRDFEKKSLLPVLGPKPGAFRTLFQHFT
jgi:hypothetical protein